MTATRGMVVSVSVAAAAGFAIGIIVDLLWPNTVYGYQMVAAVGAIALALAGLTRWSCPPRPGGPWG